jgi:hypothetical protein
MPCKRANRSKPPHEATQFHPERKRRTSRPTPRELFNQPSQKPLPPALPNGYNFQNINSRLKPETTGATVKLCLAVSLIYKKYFYQFQSVLSDPASKILSQLILPVNTRAKYPI